MVDWLRYHLLWKTLHNSSNSVSKGCQMSSPSMPQRRTGSSKWFKQNPTTWSLVIMSPFSWKGKNPQWLSFAFIKDRRVVLGWLNILNLYTPLWPSEVVVCKSLLEWVVCHQGTSGFDQPNFCRRGNSTHSIPLSSSRDLKIQNQGFQTSSWSTHVLVS